MSTTNDRSSTTSAVSAEPPRPTRRARRERRRRTERGAVAVFMALVTCFVVLPVVSFAVDLGMQRMARRDAQSLADAAAQDAARALGTGTTSVTSLTAVAQATVNASRGMIGSAAPTVTVRTGTLSSTFVGDQSLGCGASPYNSYFTATPSGSTPTAVLVTISNRVDFSLVGGGGTVCRSAIAQAYKTACMMMDSYAAQLSTGDSTVLGPITRILGTSIDLTAISSSGILSTDLDVLSFLNILKTQLNVGTVDQVLNAQVSAAQLIAAEAEALTRSGVTGAAQASVLNSQIGARVGTLLGSFRVGDLLGITQGGSSALGTTVNAFDLATAAVQLANGTNPVALTVGTPNGLRALTGVSASASATIGSRPTRVCLGEGTKTMGQTGISATVQLDTAASFVLNAVNSLVSGLQSVLNAILCLVYCETNVITLDSVRLTASASLAQASGRVDALNCSGSTPSSMTVQQSSALAPATIAVKLTFKNVYTRRTLIGIPIGSPKTTFPSLTLMLSTDDPPDSSRSATLQVPQDYRTGKAGPSGNLSVGNLTLGASTTDTDEDNVIARFLGGLGSVVNSVMNLLVAPIKPALSQLLTNLTTTLQSAVGLTIAGSTYTPLPTPGCGTPALVG